MKGKLFLFVVLASMIVFTSCKKEDEDASYLNVVSNNPAEGSTIDAATSLVVNFDYFIADESFADGSTYKLIMLYQQENGTWAKFGIDLDLEITTQSGTAAQTYPIGNLFNSSIAKYPYEIQFRITEGIAIYSDTFIYN